MCMHMLWCTALGFHCKKKTNPNSTPNSRPHSLGEAKKANPQNSLFKNKKNVLLLILANDESHVSAEFAQWFDNAGLALTQTWTYIHVSLQHGSKFQTFNRIERNDIGVFLYSRTNHTTIWSMVLIWTSVRQELSKANSRTSQTYRSMDPKCQRQKGPRCELGLI